MTGVPSRGRFCACWGGSDEESLLSLFGRGILRFVIYKFKHDILTSARILREGPAFGPSRSAGLHGVPSARRFCTCRGGSPASVPQVTETARPQRTPYFPAGEGMASGALAGAAPTRCTITCWICTGVMGLSLPSRWTRAMAFTTSTFSHCPQIV